MEDEPVKAVDNRQPDGKFGPGNNANPAGRPKGKTLKEYQAEQFRAMSDEQKEDFLKEIQKSERWRMAEGNPPQKNETEVSGNITINRINFDDYDDSTQSETK